MRWRPSASVSSTSTLRSTGRTRKSTTRTGPPWIDAHAQCGHRAVHADATGADQVLGLAARRHARTRQRALEPEWLARIAVGTTPTFVSWGHGVKLTSSMRVSGAKVTAAISGRSRVDVLRREVGAPGSPRAPAGSPDT